MMLRTCTVQVNLDYASEADMVKKLRVALALQPILEGKQGTADKDGSTAALVAYLKA